MKGEAAMPKLLQEVSGRLVSLEEGLSALDLHRTTLQNHSHKMKGEISCAVEKQMNVLRLREKQLIRQIEVASSQQNSELNVAQAQLLQHKGALAVTRSILGCCTNNNNLNNCRNGIEDACNTAYSNCGNVNQCSTISSNVRNTLTTTVNSHPHDDVAGLLKHTEKLLQVPLVSVTLDETSLMGSIQRWGKVSPPPSLSYSELLPQWLEEYGDDEHQLLHKSVQPEWDPCTVNTTTIDVRRPYLFAHRTMHDLAKASTMQSTPQHSVVSDRQSRDSKEDLEKWLHQMQLDGDCCSASVSNAQVCVEESCQANELCSSFSNCVLSGQCRKSALEKLHQTAMWRNSQQWDKAIEQEEEHDIEDNLIPYVNKGTNCASRKRLYSNSLEDPEPIKNVIGHMNSIIASNNSSWLVTDYNNEVCDNMDRMNLPNNAEHLKKIKLSTSGCDEYHDSSVRYQTPQTHWLVPSQASVPACEEKDTYALMTPFDDQNTDSDWLHPLATDSADKKANYDKENNLSRVASKLKLQLSLTNLCSNENLKDKTEKCCMDVDTSESDEAKFTEDEYLWLLQHGKADNKLIDDVIRNRNDVAVSEASANSFSVITDTDNCSNNSWLMYA